MNKVVYSVTSTSLSSVLTDFFTNIGWINLGNQNYGGINHIGFTNNTWTLFFNLDSNFKARLSHLTSNPYIHNYYTYNSGNAFLPLNSSSNNLCFYYDNKKIIIADENAFLDVTDDNSYSYIQLNVSTRYRFLIFYTWQDVNNYYALLSNDPFYPYSYSFVSGANYTFVNRRLKMLFGIQDKNDPANTVYLFNLDDNNVQVLSHYNPFIFDKMFYVFNGRATFTDKFLVSNLYLYVKYQGENFYPMDDDILYCVFENLPSNDDFLVRVGNNIYKAYRLPVTRNQDCLLIKHV